MGAREKLAVNGGTPVRAALLPYGRQTIGDEDIEAVARVLRSDWLTTGPAVEAFESAFRDATGADHAVAVSNGTAALHAAMFAVNIQPGDDVIAPAITFAASSNAAVYQGGVPKFADVDPSTLLIDVDAVTRLISNKTKAIVAVDYAGQPCDYDALRAIAQKNGIALIADACHALGAEYRGTRAGTLADVSTFSLHPVKHVTSGEGGVITTNDAELARRMRLFRNHGITTDHRQREARGSWFYEMTELGYNYRLTDIQCALGTSQVARLPGWLKRRREIAALYDRLLVELPEVRPLGTTPGALHAYHLYVVRLDLTRFSVGRPEIFAALRAEGIGVNVHYVPVYMHPFYRSRFGTGPGLCPNAEQAYEEILSLPMFPAMTDTDVQDVVDALCKVVDAFGV